VDRIPRELGEGFFFSFGKRDVHIFGLFVGTIGVFEQIKGIIETAPERICYCNQEVVNSNRFIGASFHTQSAKYTAQFINIKNQRVFFN